MGGQEVPHLPDSQLDQDQSITIDPGPVVRGLISDLRAGMPQPELAARFHRSVAEMIASVCQVARERSGLNSVGLTGGVFQNVLLLELTEARLRAVGFDVITHSVVPPNDGGIALGQAVIARSQLS